MNPVAPPSELLTDMVKLSDLILKVEHAHATGHTEDLDRLLASVDRVAVRMSRDLVAGYAKLNATIESERVAA